MLRKLLLVVLPLVLPFLIYGLYVVIARYRARMAGAGAPVPSWQDAPWGWIAGFGVLLMLVGLITMRVTTGIEPGRTIEPQRVIDGEVQPSRAID